MPTAGAGARGQSHRILRWRLPSTRTQLCLSKEASGVCRRPAKLHPRSNEVVESHGAILRGGSDRADTGCRTSVDGRTVCLKRRRLSRTELSRSRESYRFAVGHHFFTFLQRSRPGKSISHLHDRTFAITRKLPLRCWSIFLIFLTFLRENSI